MTQFENSSLKTKLIVITFIASFVSLLMVAVAVFVYEATTFRPIFLEFVGQAPRALSSSLTAPLRFSDRSRGTEALHVLAKTANFEEAVLLLSKWR